MSDDQPTTQSDEELLTAYLDGELALAETIAVEQRLGTDADFHEKMKSLQQAWDLLDNLPSAEAGDEFVRTTMEMAIQQSPSKTRFPVWLTNLVLLAALPLFFLGGSYLYSRHILGTPKRVLVRDLPLVENFDRYSKVIKKDELPNDGIRFLAEIHRRGLFSDIEDLFSSRPAETADATPIPLADSPADSDTVSPNSEVIEERTQWLQSLSQEQRNGLLNKKSEFDLLDEARQKSLRELHQQLAEHPNHQRLSNSLVSYYQWLGTLRMKERAGLLDEPVDVRLKTIRSITRQQAEEAFGAAGPTSLSDDDATILYKWYDYIINAKSVQIRDRTGEVLASMRVKSSLPPPPTADLERVKSGPIEQLVAFLIKNDRVQLGNIIMREEIGSTNGFGLQYLHEMLSDDSRKILNQRRPEKQRELVLNWLEAANKERYTNIRVKLQEFYESLTPESRDELDNLHPDEWKSTLIEKYRSQFRSNFDPSGEEEWLQFIEDGGFRLEFDL